MGLFFGTMFVEHIGQLFQEQDTAVSYMAASFFCLLAQRENDIPNRKTLTFIDNKIKCLSNNKL
jgi:type IV secretory pathway VirB4 component